MISTLRSTVRSPKHETLMMAMKEKHYDSSVRGSVVRVWIVCMLKLNQSKKLGNVTHVRRHLNGQRYGYVNGVESVSIAV